MNQAEERIHQIEDRIFEMIQSEEDKGKKNTKSEESLHDLWNSIKKNPTNL